ncbi:hypothetical protein CC79DRAFT_1338436 [Sarocladium strictum]
MEIFLSIQIQIFFKKDLSDNNIEPCPVQLETWGNRPRRFSSNPVGLNNNTRLGNSNFTGPSSRTPPQHSPRRRPSPRMASERDVMDSTAMGERARHQTHQQSGSRVRRRYRQRSWSRERRR